MNNSRLSRRRFLGATSAALAAPAIVPSSVFGADAPSNRIGVGTIGVGSRGSGHTNSALRMPGMQVLAVCDAYASKADGMKR